jgi:hypothetical protein
VAHSFRAPTPPPARAPSPGPVVCDGRTPIQVQEARPWAQVLKVCQERRRRRPGQVGVEEGPQLLRRLTHVRAKAAPVPRDLRGAAAGGGRAWGVDPDARCRHPGAHLVQDTREKDEHRIACFQR